MFIDTHCHLSKNDYENLDAEIAKIKEENVKILIVSGCDKDSIEESISLSKKYENIYLSLGYHPSEANKITKEDLEDLKKKISKNRKIVALGEIGLDYYWEKENKELQKKLFRNQLQIAKELNLPVIIHSREAFQDTYDILKEYNIPGIIHCFSGNIENAKKYISLGYLLGIGGVVTFKNTHLKDVVKEISLEKILLETDSPYLAPTPYRGKPNSPQYIPIIAEEIAKIKEINVNKVEKQTTNNALNIFRIKQKSTKID